MLTSLADENEVHDVDFNDVEVDVDVDVDVNAVECLLIIVASKNINRSWLSASSLSPSFFVQSPFFFCRSNPKTAPSATCTQADCIQPDYRKAILHCEALAKSRLSLYLTPVQRARVSRTTALQALAKTFAQKE